MSNKEVTTTRAADNQYFRAAKSSIILLAIALGTALVGTAMAAPTGLSVSADVGESRQDANCDGTTSCTLSDTGFQVSLAYNFNPYYAVEAAYVYLGQATAGVEGAQVSIKNSGPAIFAVGILPFDKWSLFAKLGVTDLQTQINATVYGVGSGSDSQTNVNLAAGLGGGYRFMSNLGVHVQWERFKSSYSNSGGSLDSNVDLFAVGLTFSFWNFAAPGET